MSAAAPPPAAPAAPAKPAAAPAAPAAAPAKPGVKTDNLSTIPTERPTSDWMGDIGDELDQLSDDGDAKAEGRKPAAKPQKKVEPPKPQDPPADPAADKPKEDDALAAEGAEPPPQAQPTKLNDLRSAYSALKKKEDSEYKPTIQKLEARVKELESATPPEVSTLQERLTTVEKRNQELEQEINYVNYSKSKEYKEKFEQPYLDAWKDAIADLAELTVENPDGTTRQATQEDLVALANMPLGAARKQANEKFGDSADDVMIHRRKILDLSNAQHKALEDAKAKGTERVEKTASQIKANNERMRALWTEATAAVTAKWPKMFGKREDDPEGNALLEKGIAMADRLFTPTEETRPKTEQEALALHALIRSKIANHDRLALWNKKARARIAELEKQLKDYEASDPNGGLSGGGDGGSGNAGNYMDDANAELERLDKQA